MINYLLTPVASLFKKRYKNTAYNQAADINGSFQLTQSKLLFMRAFFNS